MLEAGSSELSIWVASVRAYLHYKILQRFYLARFRQDGNQDGDIFARVEMVG